MYELVFWKYLEGVYLNAQIVYEALMEEETVEGLETLPVGVIINRIANYIIFSCYISTKYL